MNSINFNPIFIIAGFFIFIILSSFSFFQKPYSRSLKNINDKTYKELQRSYGMEFVGFGLGLDHSDPEKKIGALYINYSMRQTVNLNEARKIAMNAFDIFLDNVKNEPDFLKLYVVDYYDDSIIDMTIFFKSPEGEPVYDPHISVVSICNNKVSFLTDDPKPPHPYKNEFIETLEEARAKVAAQQKTLD